MQEEDEERIAKNHVKRAGSLSTFRGRNLPLVNTDKQELRNRGRSDLRKGFDFPQAAHKKEEQKKRPAE